MERPGRGTFRIRHPRPVREVCCRAGRWDPGEAQGRFASLIETAKINGVGPFAYLKATLEAIAARHPQNRIDELLPWHSNPST